MSGGGTAKVLELTRRRTDAASERTIEPLLTAVEVGRILGVRPKRVYELGIPAVRISVKALRWRRSDLEAWLEQRRGVA
jgi:predicted DNA-binding transcriptional regulator AlpA